MGLQYWQPSFAAQMLSGDPRQLGMGELFET